MNALFHGILNLEEKDGYQIPHRFTSEQAKAVEDNDFFAQRVRCAASVTLELYTQAENISLDYKFFLRTGVNSTFEVYTDGVLTHFIRDKELGDEGTLNFALKMGKKHVEIYLPNYSEVGIKNFTVDGEYQTVAQKDTKVLFIGDSITQGGGPQRSGLTYVNVTKRALDYEVLNWGIGGYSFDEKIVAPSSFNPDKIIVSMGTNNRCFTAEKNKEMIEGFFTALHKHYGNTKTLVLLPPYYGADDPKTMRQIFKDMVDCILQTVARYPSIQVASAYDMVPHLAEYYMDDFVHPNPLGMQEYGNNLVRTIQQTGF